MVDASTSRPPKTGGDDLDDDLDLDEGLLALSEPEDGEDGVILEHDATTTKEAESRASVNQPNGH